MIGFVHADVKKVKRFKFIISHKLTFRILNVHLTAVLFVNLCLILKATVMAGWFSNAVGIEAASVLSHLFFLTCYCC